MNLKYITISFVFFALLTAGAIASAEAPCTHIGQPSLQAAAACIRDTRAVGGGLGSNQATFNAIATSPIIPPPVYPSVSPYIFPYAMFVSGNYKGYPKGFQNTHLIYPNSLYLAYPGMFW